MRLFFISKLIKIINYSLPVIKKIGGIKSFIIFVTVTVSF